MLPVSRNPVALRTDPTRATAIVMMRVPNESFPTWWRGAPSPPPATWKYTFELFTGDETADEWALAAAIFIAQYRRRNSRSPTFREVFEFLLDDTRGLPARLSRDWDKGERRRAIGGFRWQVMLDWRRRGFIGFDRHVTRSLRVGPHFRERSRQLQAATNQVGGAIAEGRAISIVEPRRLEPTFPVSTADTRLSERPLRTNIVEEDALNGSLTTQQVIARLKLTTSNLRRLREAHYLHAVSHAGDIRYPEWQFSNEPNRPVVFGINIVSVAIPKNWGLAAIDAFMQAANSALSIDGHPQTPALWLDRGGDPLRVVEILEEVAAK